MTNASGAGAGGASPGTRRWPVHGRAGSDRWSAARVRRRSAGSRGRCQRGGLGDRGFLFADLRDHTAYVELHGDRAGAALLDRYRSLVRDVVAVAHGAEVRTEGDSFYVVFGSVSAAVRAGLAIVNAAAATAADPAPIRVGVGVHAGETVERADGFVGSAVNIAARLCAEARAGDGRRPATPRRAGAAGGDRATGPTDVAALEALVAPLEDRASR